MRLELQLERDLKLVSLSNQKTYVIIFKIFLLFE